jgi:hypothetical protein
MTTQETKQMGFTLIKKLIVLKMNVANGCSSDKEDMMKQEARLPKVAQWAKDNGMLNDFRHYFTCGNFGMQEKFYALEVSKSFNI